MEPLETPHGKSRGLRIFLFEIFTITVGLFIALALNDFVEWQQHRSLVRAAETSLRTEIDGNLKTLASIRGQIRDEQAKIDGDLLILRQFRDQPAATPDRKMSLEFKMEAFDDTAWKTAQATGAFTYMPYPEVETYSSIYYMQGEVIRAQQEAVNDALGAAALLITKPKGERPSPAEIGEIIPRLGMFKMRLIFLSALIDSLDRNYQDYRAGGAQRRNHADRAPTPSRS
jgi:hypothetical protein